MSDLLHWFQALDLSTPFAVLVWVSVLLTVAWIATIERDPANKDIPHWKLLGRRLGLIVTEFGLLSSVLFGEDLKWTVWPPMFLVVVGLVLYLSASLSAAYQRIRVFEASHGLVPHGFR